MAPTRKSKKANYNQPSKGKTRQNKQVTKTFKKKKEKKKWRDTDKSSNKIKLVKNAVVATSKNIPQVSTKTKISVEQPSLRDKMMKRLDAARFRQMNEELDSATHSDPKEAFGSHVELFEKYHEAYKERIQHWPTDPLNLITAWIKKKIDVTTSIADFGCGEARLAQSVPHTVHSFDLFALNERVTACDMSNCPLENESVGVAVFCLSLMGINISKFILEANRVLKHKGILKIAEVASRFPDNNYSGFVQKMKKFGFVSKVKVQEGNTKNTQRSNEEVFFMFEFMKIRPVKLTKGDLPVLKLKPCVYKRR